MRAIVEEGVAELLGLVNRFNEISEKFAEPLDDDAMAKLLEEQGKLQDKIESVGGWEIERKLEIAADALRLPQWDASVQSLSGGERNRVHLAKVLRSGGNLLMLDEPTNDLDVETLRAIEEALLSFPGCAIVISHDRWFLDRIATHILAFEGDSRVVWFEGNYQAYEVDLKRRLGKQADEPRKFRYRKLADG